MDTVVLKVVINMYAAEMSVGNGSQSARQQIHHATLQWV